MMQPASMAGNRILGVLNTASALLFIVVVVLIAVLLLLLLLLGYLGRYIPEEGKKLMKKIEVWRSTNPGGRKTKNRRAKAPR